MIATMPPAADIKHIAAQKKEALIKIVTALQGSMPAAGEEASYHAADLDDSQWPTMRVPGEWEQAGQGLDGLDGVVWVRKTIELPASSAGVAATVDLGPIDDNDVTYVNGVKVGSTNGYNDPRHYTIPAGVLKAGKNVIAVRVHDTGGGGGMHGQAADMKLVAGTTVLSLAGD